MNILAFDSTGAACAAAVMVDDRIAAARGIALVHGHAEVLPGLLRAVMAEAGLGFTDLGLVAVTTGPGGFTGLRVGLATARGIGLAAGLPVIGITRFDAIAASLGPGTDRPEKIVVALDSRRAEFYVQLFAAPAGAQPIALGEASMVGPDQLGAFVPAGPWCLVGDAAERAAPILAVDGRRDVVVVANDPADATALARLARSRAVAGGWSASTERPDPVEPLYLRAPDVTLAAPG